MNMTPQQAFNEIVARAYDSHGSRQYHAQTQEFVKVVQAALSVKPPAPEPPPAEEPVKPDTERT